MLRKFGHSESQTQQSSGLKVMDSNDRFRRKYVHNSVNDQTARSKFISDTNQIFKTSKDTPVDKNYIKNGNKKVLIIPRHFNSKRTTIQKNLIPSQYLNQVSQ